MHLLDILHSNINYFQSYQHQSPIQSLISLPTFFENECKHPVGSHEKYERFSLVYIHILQTASPSKISMQRNIELNWIEMRIRQKNTPSEQSSKVVNSVTIWFYYNLICWMCNLLIFPHIFYIFICNILRVNIVLRSDNEYYVLIVCLCIHRMVGCCRRVVQSGRKTERGVKNEK